MIFKKHIVFVLFLLINISAFSVENRPKMRRVCLNRSDSTVNLLWYRPTDNCGSFTSFSVYGRDDILGLYNFMGKWNDFALDNVQLKLKNLRSWEFYLVYNTNCAGTDSIYSDTLIIDITAPENSLIDSVSVDLATQKTQIGWKTNNSKDNKGYYIYNVTGVNTIIHTTAQINYLDIGSRDPSTQPVSYSIAAFDSCNIASLISQAHTTMHLTNTYNECNKTISLSWTNYLGWAVESYQIYRKINANNYQLVGTVVPQISQFTYNFTTFGDIYCFFIRAKKVGENTTSSSNESCRTSSNIIASANSYVAKATVNNKNIELTLITETGTSLQAIDVYKSENNGAYFLFETIPTTGGVINRIDTDVKTDRFSYSYYFTTTGPCNFIFDTSQVSTTILLKVLMINPGNQDLKWSLYDDFIKNTQNQQILLGNSPNFNNSSPWNTLTTVNNTETTHQDFSVFGLNENYICYCVRAIENSPTPPYIRQDTSYSNISCITAEPIVYFPNAIQINGFNTKFIPKGQFIDTSKSELWIFNRWGEQVKKISNISEGWDGKDTKDELVVSDIYVYKCMVVALNGTILLFTGTITVLK